VFGDVGIFPELTLLTLSGKQLQTGHNATAWGAAADLRARLGFTWAALRPSCSQAPATLCAGSALLSTIARRASPSRAGTPALAPGWRFFSAKSETFGV